MSRSPFLAAVYTILFLLLVAASTGSAFGAIEAIEGKRYSLTKQNGPWLIMVTSLYAEKNTSEAEKAADSLVYELRKKGIPAYVHSIDNKLEHVNMTDRLGRDDRYVYAAQRKMVGVLAGNYPTIEDATGQRTLKFVKTFRPKVLEQAGYNVKDKNGPLHRAFLTLNPLLKPGEYTLPQKDPLLLKLNGGVDHSILENKGRFTVVVASFHGKSQVKPAEFTKFDEKIRNNSSLDEAGQDAWELVRTMRAQNIEAYVFHDRYRSIVTVGAFDKPDDPKIAKIQEAFRSKWKKHPDSGKDVLVAESIQIPGRRPGEAPLKSWLMDPQPEIIEVPRIRK